MLKNPTAETEDQVIEKIKQIKDFDLKLRLIAVAHQIEKRKLLDKQQEKEISQIEKKFNTITAPLYKQSNDIINSVRLPTAEETEKLDEFLNEQEKQNKESYLKNTDPISGYWLKALKNALPIKDDITTKDETILVSLRKIESEVDPENDDFALSFTFEENDFFTNDVLKVKFFVKDQQEAIKTESTPINWKEGKNITKKIVKKKKNKKLKVKEVEQDSFFNIFKTIDTSSKEFLELTKEQQSELQFKIGTQFELGSLIFNEIIPYSLEYFLGVKVGDEEEEDDEAEEEDDDDEGVEDLSKEEAIERMKARFKPKKK